MVCVMNASSVLSGTAGKPSVNKAILLCVAPKLQGFTVVRIDTIGMCSIRGRIYR